MSNPSTPAAPKRLFVDMDGTLAEFRPVNHIEALYEKGYFENLQPNRNVVEAVRKIAREHPEVEVNILSAHLPLSHYALDEKNRWIERYLPEISPEHRIFPPYGMDKTKYISGGVRSTDVLLDDYTQNLTRWEPPARGLKLLNGINHTHGTWQSDCIRYDKSPDQLAENILSVLDGRHCRDEKPDSISPPDDELTETLMGGDDPQHVEDLLKTGRFDLQRLHNGTTYLHEAVLENDLKSAQKLLEYGAYPDALNGLNYTPLTHAVEGNNLSMASLLLESGANPELNINGVPVAAHAQSPQMTDLLTDYSQGQAQGRSAAKGRAR